MTEDVEDFLEHFGIKGQKWGVRKKSNSNSEAKPNKTRQAFKKRIAIGVGVGVVSAAGAMFAAKQIGLVGGTSVGNVGGSRIKDGASIAKNMMKIIGKKRMSDLPTLNEIRYSPNWFGALKTLERVVELTQ